MESVGLCWSTHSCEAGEYHHLSFITRTHFLSLLFWVRQGNLSILKKTIYYKIGLVKFFLILARVNQ